MAERRHLPGVAIATLALLCFVSGATPLLANAMTPRSTQPPVRPTTPLVATTWAEVVPSKRPGPIHPGTVPVSLPHLPRPWNTVPSPVWRSGLEPETLSWATAALAIAGFALGWLAAGSLRKPAAHRWAMAHGALDPRGEAPVTGAGKPKTKVLFVCLGNICRSPTAEAVFTSVVEKAGLADEFVIDSCGTGGGSPDWYKPNGFSYHEGNLADSRMTKAAAARGVKLTSRSRPLQPEDLAAFDFVIGMDGANLTAIRRAAEYWRADGSAAVPPDYPGKVSLMTDYLMDPTFRAKYDHVPDPYFGGAAGFEVVLDLLEDACTGLLRAIRARP
eukprot:EG_transcript_17041